MKTRRPAQPARYSAERGQTAVEFAIIASVMLLIIVFIVDLGRVSYFAAVVHNAAREGARYGSIAPEDTAGIEAAVEHLAIGIPPDDLVIDITADPDAETIEVRVSFDLPILTPVVSALLGGADTVLLDSASTVGYER